MNLPFKPIKPANPTIVLDDRASELFTQHLREIYRRTDRIFAGLLIFEWLVGIVIALWISPLAWAGARSYTHPHLWVAIVLGALIISLPVTLALLRPARTSTRHVIAAGQILYSALLIHLTGGRIETHFHIFGSLAFLAFYRDWKVLVTASLIVAADHFLRGMFWPQSVFGVIAAGDWRWLEHTAWVVFEDVFLFISISQSVREMRAIAVRRGLLEVSNQTTEAVVIDRTAELLEKTLMAELSADIGRILTDNKELHDSLTSCAQAVAHRLGGAFVRIWTLNNQKDTLDLQAAAGQAAGGGDAFTHIHVGEHYVGRIAENRRPFATNFAGKDPEFDGGRQSGTSAATAFAGYPLIVENRLVGVLAIVATKPFSEFALKAFGTISDTIALGINRKLAERARIRLEEQFHQSQKMDAIGQLAGGVAHDFNNMLTVINGRSELLLMKLDKAAPIRKDIELIRQTGGRAAGLTRQLLAFSRRQFLEPKVVDLNAIAENMKAMLQRMINENISLITILSPKLNRVLADPGQIEQVIMNLAVNARDAMPKGGKIIIETANFELSDDYCRLHPEARPGPCVMLAVSDTGCGMSAEIKARIFEPFFTTKEKGKGTGLGLSTVQGIVVQSGGSIEVYSEPGRGTTFRIYLPQSKSDAVASATNSLLPMVSNAVETVLVVEDEDGVRTLITDLLQMDGYTVLTASQGKEALDVCETCKRHIDLLISDVVMPEMGGPELATALLKRRPDLKVLFTSGYTDNAVIHAGLLNSSMQFIQKPFQPKAFVRKVREVLEMVQSAP